MANPSPSSTPSAAARLEAQVARHAALSQKLSTLAGQRDAELRALEEVRAEVRAEFGVAELPGLRAQLESSLRANDQLVTEFTQTLDDLERAVAAVESALGA